MKLPSVGDRVKVKDATTYEDMAGHYGHVVETCYDVSQVVMVDLMGRVGDPMDDLRSLSMSTDADVYPVGVLEAWQHRKMPGKLRSCFRYLRYQARQGNWRAVRNSFNGYLAESRVVSADCGHGWTKRRALARLERILNGEP